EAGLRLGHRPLGRAGCDQRADRSVESRAREAAHRGELPRVRLRQPGDDAPDDESRLFPRHGGGGRGGVAAGTTAESAARRPGQLEEDQMATDLFVLVVCAGLSAKSGCTVSSEAGYHSQLSCEQAKDNLTVFNPPPYAVYGGP